jgi:hypothetical protein
MQPQVFNRLTELKDTSGEGGDPTSDPPTERFRYSVQAIFTPTRVNGELCNVQCAKTS